jgi:hypothetical protein
MKELIKKTSFAIILNHMRNTVIASAHRESPTIEGSHPMHKKHQNNEPCLG